MSTIERFHCSLRFKSQLTCVDWVHDYILMINLTYASLPNHNHIVLNINIQVPLHSILGTEVDPEPSQMYLCVRELVHTSIDVNWLTPTIYLLLELLSFGTCSLHNLLHSLSVNVCKCVCEREREREGGEGGRERERERGGEGESEYVCV